MVLDGGAVSGSAVASTFTAILRISQAVYELKAVGEQTRDLLDTTKYVNSSLESVRELRRKKSDLLNREEKRWIDQQVDFTQKAVDSVAVLIERARVDMQAKNETGNEDDFKTKHIKIHHRARFVLEDGPKVQTNLMKVTMAMNGLNSAMVTLSSREGQQVHLSKPKSGARRSTSPSMSKAPPPYADHNFMNRRRTLAETQGRDATPNLGFGIPEQEDWSHGFGRQLVPEPSLRSRESFSSITPSINFTMSTISDQYSELAIADDTISPACLPTSSIRDSIGSEAYFGPHELEASTTLPLSHACYSKPEVPKRAPTIPRKPIAYQTHQGSIPSINSVSIHDEFAAHRSNHWTSSTSQFQAPKNRLGDAQKDLPMLPLHLTPTQSTVSLNSTLSDLSSGSSSAMGPPSVSRGRSWLMDRANQAKAGNTAPLSRSQSSILPYPYHSPDDIRAELGQ